MSKFKKPLPYKLNALEPHLSSEQMRFHYEEHYAGYCANLDKLIKDTEYQDQTLTQIVFNTKPPLHQHATDPIYNNAAQVKNHEFFFQSLTPDKSEMSDDIKQAIEASYGSVDWFMATLKNKVTSFFGAGWVWVTISQHRQWDSPTVQIVTTRDGNTLVYDDSNETSVHGALLTIDVWEHAYYIDYRNKRADYFDAISNVIDWKTVSERYDAHKSTLFDYTKPFEL